MVKPDNMHPTTETLHEAEKVVRTIQKAKVYTSYFKGLNKGL